MARRKKTNRVEQVVEHEGVIEVQGEELEQIAPDSLVETSEKDLEKPEVDGVVEVEKKTRNTPKSVKHRVKELRIDFTKPVEILNVHNGSILARPKRAPFTVRSSQLVKFYPNGSIKGKIVSVAPKFETQFTVFNVNYEEGYVIISVPYVAAVTIGDGEGIIIVS